MSLVAIRVVDVTVSAVLLLALLPLLALAALAIRLDSPGPALFLCDRVGFRGRRLRMIKFRKMRREASGPALTADRDERFTRIGGLLARLKVDEVPQLWNVLRGDMSLVGPRPENDEFVALYEDAYSHILTVRPGITGLSQLAFAEEGRILDELDPRAHYVDRILPQKVGMDKMYADRQTLGLNLTILFWTVAAVFIRRPIAVDRGTGAMRVRRR